jgi:hypothetical protein
MANDVNIKVNPTPIQRNRFDTTVELLNMYLNRKEAVNADELDGLFVRFYALTAFVESKSLIDLQKSIPENVLKLVGKYKSAY